MVILWNFVILHLLCGCFILIQVMPLPVAVSTCLASGIAPLKTSLPTPRPRGDQHGDQRGGGPIDRHAVDPLLFAKRRLQGVMKFSKRGKVPVNLFPHDVTKKMSYLCANASTLGLACLRDAKKSCNFVHVLKLSELPSEHRTILKIFIDNHADLTLAKPG
jgi:hypothetical protein